MITKLISGKFNVWLILILLLTACGQKQQGVSESAATSTPAAAESQSSQTAPSPTPTEPIKAVPIEFTDVTAQAGIKFRHNNGAYGKKYLPETTGSGCAFLDYDNDGWQDLLLINSMDFEDAPKKRRSVMALYHNNQNGTFTDVTAQAGLARPMYGMGAAIGDYDNDGWQDIYVSCLGANHLFRNLGNGKFADVTAKTGVAGLPGDFSTSAAWLDYDKDGRLDLFVGNYVAWSIDKDLNCTLDGTNKSYCTPESYKGQTARLYHNLGNKFEEVTEKAGLNDPTSKSLGVATFDFNRDGWLDIFVSNDTQPNKLYKNNGNGTFSEVAVTAGVAFSEEGKARAGMGVDVADYDGSGYPSLIIGNFSNEMLGVYHNEGKSGLFIDEAPASTLGQATLLSLTFGLFFFDYDLDGRQDIFLANGHVADDINKVQPKITYAMPPKLFRNEGRKKFSEVSRKAGKPFQKASVARGTAYGDFDNDGDLDILVTTNGGPAMLLRNDGGNQNRFVKFRTVGSATNHDGIGTKITVVLPDGSKQWQMVHSGSSYCSQSELALTFGIGSADKIERVDIEWPSGKVEKLAGVAINQLHTLKEANGIAESKALPMAMPSPSPSPAATTVAPR
ncbi:MAG: CRTAC1 family protein [Acidobacteria bacterium]|nr:CRTAC1 family protein [Acidobacteriota bacterium]